MEKPGWIPVVLSGAFPKGTADALAMIAIVIASANYLSSPSRVLLTSQSIWCLVTTIALVGALASRSDGSRKLREELALVAYGGSGWQIWLRYFARGLALTLIAVLPLLYVEYTSQSFQIVRTIALGLTISSIGGLAYASPSMSRIRSAEFVENYKG